MERNNEPVKQEHTEQYWLHEINNARADGYERGYMAAKKLYAEPVKQEPVAVISESAIGLVKLHSNGACLPFGTQLYAAPVDAKAIRAEERQRCIEAIRKAHHKELCDVWDCIEVIKELE